MSEYFELLMNKKISEADECRKNSIPPKLIKFISLSDDESLNEKKFQTLEQNELWFSSIEKLNDPYEYKCLYVDREKLKENSYPDQFIDFFKCALEKGVQELALASLSGNSFDSLPMWAYYTNNYRGFCVEYEVVRPDYIFPISYVHNRVPIATIVANFYTEFQKMLERGEKTNEDVEFYATILQHQFFLNHYSWEHEKEYRIIYPKGDNSGLNVQLVNIGLRATKIVAGKDCSEPHLKQLKKIAEIIGCAPVLQTRISNTDYTLLEEI